jgi:hypothetical protein
VSDPYRTPGKVETIEQRREKLRQRLLMLQSFNGANMTAEQRRRWNAEYDRLYELLHSLR